MFVLFRALPLLWQLGIGAAALAAVGGGIWAVHHHIYQSGYDAAISDVAAQNKEAVDAADKARAAVRACNAVDGMRWDQFARQCVRG